MNRDFEENEGRKAALHQLMREIDAKYPPGLFAAIGDDRVIAVAADFDELLGELRAQGRNPRDTLVVETGAERPEYVTIFI